MNHKIIEKLEFSRVTDYLSEFAITAPAKKRAKELLPENDFEKVQKSIDQTRVLSNILRIKGPLPLTDFRDVRYSLKRLKVKANLNAIELGNIFLVLRLTKDIATFTEDLEEREINVDPIIEYLNNLEIPEELYQKLENSLEFDGSILDSASIELAKCRHDIHANEVEIKNIMDKYIKGNLSKYLSDAIITVRDNRYVIPVKQEYKNKFGGIVHDQSASGQTLYVEPEGVLVLNNRQQNLRAQEHQEIQRILKSLSNLTRDYQDEIYNNSSALAELDFISAKSKLAKQMKAVEPTLTKNHEVKLKAARHPLIDPHKVVANDIELGTTFDTMLITGPNTGGKTITLKTIGLLELMAQSGLFITANEGSKVGVFNEVYADIGDEQSIEQSLSTFSSHMDQIIKIMNHVNDDDLVLIDELGSGTDPEEGASLAISILDYLRRSKAKIMITTHYPELKLYGYNRPRTTNASMEFDIESLSPTYRLTIGIPGQSNAFAIASQLGMDKSVVEYAQHLTNDTNSEINQMIEKLSIQTKKAEDFQAEMSANLDRSVSLKNKLQAGLDWYNQQVNLQLEKAQTKADLMIEKKRKKADKIINDLEEQRKNGTQIKTNQIIAAKGELNSLTREKINLAKNKVLKNEKKRHEIKVGNSVKVLSYGQTGIITKKLSEHEFEAQIGVLKIKVTDQDVEKINVSKPKKDHVSVRSSRGLRSTGARPSLDLRGQRYEEAINNLDRYIDSSLLAGLNTVTIVHGIGTGAIRKGVQDYLKRSKHIKDYSYAPASEGGTGATIVHLS